MPRRHDTPPNITGLEYIPIGAVANIVTRQSRGIVSLPTFYRPNTKLEGPGPVPGPFFQALTVDNTSKSSGRAAPGRCYRKSLFGGPNKFFWRR